MDEIAEWIDLLDVLEPRGLLDEHPGRLRRFMLSACGLLAEHLPLQSARWIAVADAYARGAASVEELTAARLEAAGVAAADSVNYHGTCCGW